MNVNLLLALALLLMIFLITSISITWYYIDRLEELQKEEREKLEKDRRNS